MATRDSQPEVPTWVAGLVVAAVVLTLAYVFVFGGHIFGPLTGIVAALQFALGLFVVYLLYRFVLAVETIAEKM